MISLCNLLYKLTTKIIADRFKPILGKFILDRHFGFMPNRQLLDVVSIARECFHSLKKEKKKAFILKMDLIKAYDRLYWCYLILILIQTSLSYKVTEWIMGCTITSSRFVVLINGSPSCFFHGN